eukprot:6180721-Pleurochrysis_carterae.AAC.1
MLDAKEVCVRERVDASLHMLLSVRAFLCVHACVCSLRACLRLRLFTPAPVYACACLCLCYLVPLCVHPCVRLRAQLDGTANAAMELRCAPLYLFIAIGLCTQVDLVCSCGQIRWPVTWPNRLLCECS